MPCVVVDILRQSEKLIWIIGWSPIFRMSWTRVGAKKKYIRFDTSVSIHCIDVCTYRLADIQSRDMWSCWKVGALVHLATQCCLSEHNVAQGLKAGHDGGFENRKRLMPKTKKCHSKHVNPNMSFRMCYSEHIISKMSFQTCHSKHVIPKVSFHTYHSELVFLNMSL